MTHYIKNPIITYSIKLIYAILNLRRRENELFKSTFYYHFNDWINSINAEQSSNLPDFEFVTIKSDSFKMGSPFWERHRDRDEKRARVTISKSFEMMTTEVTQLQWFTIMRDNPSSFKEKQYCEDDFKVIPTDNGDISLCPNHPVERVSWDRVQEFISKLNNQENLTGCDEPPKAQPDVTVFLLKQSGN